LIVLKQIFLEYQQTKIMVLNVLQGLLVIILLGLVVPFTIYLLIEGIKKLYKILK
jgi:hypothetical protein